MARLLLLSIVLLLAGLFSTQPASAQSEGDLSVGPAPDLEAYLQRPLDDVRVETEQSLWRETVNLTSVKPGDLPSPELVRRGMRELERTHRYAEIRAELFDNGTKLTLVYWVRPRRLVAKVRVEGSSLDERAERRALRLKPGDEVTERSLKEAKLRLLTEYQQAGYPEAAVELIPEETDDPMDMVIRVDVEPGTPTLIRAIRYRVAPSPHDPILTDLLRHWSAKVGQRADRARIDEAAEDLTTRLAESRFYEAEIRTQLQEDVLVVFVKTGPRFDVRVEGQHAFGAERIAQELKLAEHRDPRAEVLEPLLQDFYVRHGFLDARIQITRLAGPTGLRSELVVSVREGPRFKVTERHYPCAGGTRTPGALDREVEGVLGEELPGLTVLHPTNAQTLDEALGGGPARARATPLPVAPFDSYSEEAYGTVRAHLEDLYRSEGYLDAEVGPVTVARRRCKKHTQPGICIPIGPVPLPQTQCTQAAEKRDSTLQTCVPDPTQGIRCESEGVVLLPIRPGRQAVLYDVVLEGNERFTEKALLDVAKLRLGEPVRLAEIDRALGRIQDLYAEEAYAFALVDSEIELSPDRTRARLLISITERETVTISRIVIQGATRTREGLVRSRLAIHEGGLYKKSLVDRSQRQIDSLGVFASVSVGMEDAGVPARKKVVVVTVTERLPQYLDIKGGFATADGFRIGFEYGHRNLGGEAVALTIRSQLAIRPLGLIPEEDVRERYSTLSGTELLERRNTITFGFPHIGLGPRYRFEIELLDVRDNNRDFGLTRDAGVVRLQYVPARKWWTQLGATVERNDANIIGDEEQRGSLEDYVRENEGTVRVPEGASLAITQNLGAVWDRRDRPLAATRGTHVSVGTEHVKAIPLDKPESACVEEADEAYGATCSQLLRWTGRLAGYIPFNKRGLSLALSFRGGVVTHLTEDSRTYTDRLFFLGGVESLRGYPQDSLVPQDLAELALDEVDPLPIENIVLRGGDLFINPRAELRIPLMGSLSTALFVDAGNLWTQAAIGSGTINPFDLVYTAGTGIRFDTPVGPLVFDYGFNLGRVLDELDPGRENQRFWEDLGAFHFTIGLF